MSGSSFVTPLSHLRVSSHQIPAFNRMPNTSIQRKPLLIYHSAFHARQSASVIEAHLESVGTVEPQWQYTMYGTSHFHSTTHEVLCVIDGRARLCFGGEANPERVEVLVTAGDVIIVPAGVAHCLLEDLEANFRMVGSYPPGKAWDMCYGEQGEEERVKGIANVEWFERDPVYGDQGPSLSV